MSVFAAATDPDPTPRVYAAVKLSVASAASAGMFATETVNLYTEPTGGVPEEWVNVMPPVRLVAVQVGAPVQLVMHVPLLPAVWKASAVVPVLVVPMTIVPAPLGLLPGSTTVTSTVNDRPVSLMMKPDAGAKTRSGTTLPTAIAGAPVTLNELLVTLLNPELDAISVYAVPVLLSETLKVATPFTNG